ncbi:MAG: AMP-binding protein [Deltaproteobacteria bacterium]|nr:AMP-binding protein [Deltaproteobacteria bacterium]MBW2118695.1 AMP-binding protein [Deltaproteobacteria bacterium]MBW2343828.1 AMP-binding protein [Deltaproteobacteria bacterium]
MGLQDYTVYDIICRNARVYPDRDSIVSNETRLTHGQFKEKCDMLAAGLVKAGIGKGDRLGVMAHNCDEFMILYGAAAKMGAIVLPVNWRFQQDEMEFVLNDCTPKFVFAGPDYRKMVEEAVGKVKSIEKCYTMGGGEVPEGFHSFDELYSDDAALEEIDLPADSGFVIIHTAAVAGKPRGALLSQSNIVHCNVQMMLGNGLGPEDSFICILPLFHIAALSMAMAVMHAGGKNVLIDRFDPELTLRLIEKEKGTSLVYFPPILQMLMDKYEEAGGTFDLSSIRNVGGLDSADNILRLKKVVPNARVSTGYGQTEAFPVSGGLMEEKPGSTGKPSPLAKVALFDDYDNEVPVGTPGEICVRSPVVFLGYWGLDEDTAYTFRNGWHHTGDIGRFDKEGYLRFLKRKAEKELIKPGGENVYPVEVEKAILEHEKVAEVSVIGVPDKKWGEAIKAVCVLKQGETLDQQELSEFVASKIARYKKPQYVAFVDALPKTKDNEIDRDQVKKDHGGKY